MTRPASRSRRMQQRALETRSALLQAACDAFSRRGYDGVSVRQIEEKAGVKRGLVAYHFTDKASLWRAAVDQLFSDVGNLFGSAEALRDAVDKADALAAARFIARAFVRHSAMHPEMNRLVVQESMQPSWRVSYLVTRHIRPMMDRMALELPAAAAALWGSNDVHRYYLFVGASAFVFSAEQECEELFGVSPRTEEFVERHAELVVDLLLPGLNRLR